MMPIHICPPSLPQERHKHYRLATDCTKSLSYGTNKDIYCEVIRDSWLRWWVTSWQADCIVRLSFFLSLQYTGPFTLLCCKKTRDEVMKNAGLCNSILMYSTLRWDCLASMCFCSWTRMYSCVKHEWDQVQLCSVIVIYRVCYRLCSYDMAL